MSTDKPFPVEPGREYKQAREMVGTTEGWEIWNGLHQWMEPTCLHFAAYLNHWFRRKPLVPQPKSEWVRFADREPGEGQRIWVYVESTQQMLPYSSFSYFKRNEPLWECATHWHEANAPTPPPVEPNQEEKDRSEAERSWFSYKTRVEEDPSPDCPTRRETYETAFLAGIQHGRKSK